MGFHRQRTMWLWRNPDNVTHCQLLSIDQVWRQSTALTWSRWGCRRLADNIWLLAHDNNNNTEAVFPSVLWRCSFGKKKGIWPVKSWTLACWWWWLDWSFARIIAPVVTTTSIILAPIKFRMKTFWNPLERSLIECHCACIYVLITIYVHVVGQFIQECGQWGWPQSWLYCGTLI